MNKYNVSINMKSDYETFSQELINEILYLGELIGPTYTKAAIERVQELGVAVRLTEEAKE